MNPPLVLREPQMTQTPVITIARGDGIGPEIMDATLLVLKEAGAQLEMEEIEIGKAVYARGIPTGIEDSSWSSLRRTKVFLKAPITTPQGGGFKSLNVTVRKTLGLFANVRPCISYAPYVETKHPNMNLVIIRENEEDLYGGIEYRQSQDVMASLKIITRPGSEKIARYAFEYARSSGRKKVTCMTKDNIMKMSDGLFHKVFDEIGQEYPDIQQDHYIIDIGSARIASAPETFDVILVPNLYGDIVSDIAAEITGSVGLGGSANVGERCAMFEAIHGSAPDIAGKGIANPSGLILGAVMMLVHIGQNDVAARIHNAWLQTIEEGIHTGDIYREGKSRERVGTNEFTKALISRLGQQPRTLPAINYGENRPGGMILPPLKPRVVQNKTLVGTDIFVNWEGKPDDLADLVLPLVIDGLELSVISNRGVKVWPRGLPETFCTDDWRLRLMGKNGELISHRQVVSQLNKLCEAGIDFVKTEHLYSFDGESGFSAAQGQ